MPTRHDISGVPLQDSYVAKRCPVRAQNEIIFPTEPYEPDPFTRRLFELGSAFEGEIVDELLASEPEAVVIETTGSKAEADTLRAMSRGAPLILNGRIVDAAARRVGRPDVLVLTPDDLYRAVDVKSHGALEEPGQSGKSAPALVSPLTSVRFEAALPDPTFAAQKREEDVLQLAHYQRILESMGFGVVERRFAGTIGTERRLLWHDLDAAIWRTPSLSAKSKLRSAMDRYDFEFDFRLDIIAVSLQHQVDPTVDLLVVPVRCHQCPTCPWTVYCAPILETPPGDVSLLPRIGWIQRKVHHDHGVTNLAELAALDVATAQLVAQGVNVERLLMATEGEAPTTVLESIDGIALRAKEVSALKAAGITTVGDLADLCRVTAGYSGSGLPLPTHIDLARAFLGPEATYRKRGVAALTVPRADVEVDIDMESVQNASYMWGCLVTDRSGVDLVPQEYRAFVTWDELTPEVEAENSLNFWRWFTSVRDQVISSGHTFHAYCFNATAENTQLRRLATSANIANEIELFIASDEWVDMLRVWDSQLITGGFSRLKTIAPLAGFSWQVDDPGGSESMVQYDAAVSGAPEATSAQEWLLRYNRGDVEATFAVRQWIDRAVIRSIEDLGS